MSEQPAPVSSSGANPIEGNRQYLIFDPLRVDLPVYEGPFEALLDMIRKKKLSVYTVSLAEICQPFLEYLKRAESVNLEIGSDFISMASSLIYIKSKTLLPKHEIEEEEEEEADVWEREEEIRAKLVELEKFERISAALQNREHLYREFFPRPDSQEFQIVSEQTRIPAELSLYSLIASFNELSTKAKFRKNLLVEQEADSLQSMILSVLGYLFENDYFEFSAFLKIGSKTETVLLFLSVLELTKKGALGVVQNETFSDLHCRRADGFGEIGTALAEEYAATEKNRESAA